MSEYTVEELAGSVQAWCEKHGILPANGQASEALSERTIRYYRTLGLLAAPAGGGSKAFNDRHRLQLIAIRVYQAQGIPLRKIREQLYGQSLEDLAKFEQAAARAGAKGLARSLPLGPLAPVCSAENWSVIPLGQGFMLVAREQRHVPAAVLEKIQRLLAFHCQPPNDHQPANLN